MHQTLTIGRARYVGRPETLAAIFALHNGKKPSKPRPKADRRRFPVFVPGMSTADYVAEYFSLNTRVHGGIHAYECSAYRDVMALYAPLNTEPATLPSGEETIEIEE